MTKKQRKSETLTVRMTPERMHALRALAERLGLSMGSVVELLVRQAAKKEGVR